MLPVRERMLRLELSGSQDRTIEAIEAMACAELQKSCYAPVREVQCECRQGVLTLCGRVPSYFIKQIAQAILLRSLAGKVALDNQLAVDSGDGAEPVQAIQPNSSHSVHPAVSWRSDRSAEQLTPQLHLFVTGKHGAQAASARLRRQRAPQTDFDDGQKWA